MHREKVPSLAFTYQNEKLKARVERFCPEWGFRARAVGFPVTFADDARRSTGIAEAREAMDGLDCIVHRSVGFCPRRPA